MKAHLHAASKAIMAVGSWEYGFHPPAQPSSLKASRLPLCVPCIVSLPQRVL
jgi:hypothetical protein